MSALFGLVRRDGAPIPPETVAALRAVFPRAGIRAWDGALLGGTFLGERLAWTGWRVGGRSLEEAWDREGPRCLETLDGEFALARWDPAARELSLAHSRLALCYLYLLEAPWGVAWSTRAEALLALPGVPRRLDPEGFCGLVAGYAHTDPRRTWLQGIALLPPDERLSWTPERSLRARVWEARPDPEAARVGPAEGLEVLRARLLGAVADACRGQDPVGLLLSGGLDSSAVACAMPRALRRVALSAVLPPGSDLRDERPWIEIACRELGLELRAVDRPDGGCPWRIPDEHFQTVETPVVPLRHDVYRALYAAAREAGVSAILEGGGGEMGASARAEGVVLRWLLAGRWDRLWREARASGWRRILGEIRRALRRPRSKRVLGPLAMLRRVPPARPRPEDLPGMPPEWEKQLRGGADVDRALEIRRPLRTPGIWTWCSGLPADLRLRDGLDRRLVRDALAGLMPEPLRLRTCTAAMAADHPRRLVRTLPEAFGILEGCSRQDSVRELLDVPGTRALLDRLATGPFDLEAGARAQVTLAAMQFLRWGGF